MDLSGDPDFAELVRRARDVALDAYANQDIPFERLVERLGPRRIPGRTPFFQVTFSTEEGGPRLPELPGMTVSLLPLGPGPASGSTTVGSRAPSPTPPTCSITAPHDASPTITRRCSRQQPGTAAGTEYGKAG
jgi:hypothetical protein